MTRIAIYPGSFDPPTKGHEDLIQRSLALCDQLIVAVAVNFHKEPLFSPDERLVAATVTEGSNEDVWVYDITRGVRTRLTAWCLRSLKSPITSRI